MLRLEKKGEGVRLYHLEVKGWKKGKHNYVRKTCTILIYTSYAVCVCAGYRVLHVQDRRR